MKEEIKKEKVKHFGAGAYTVRKTERGMRYGYGTDRGAEKGHLAEGEPYLAALPGGGGRGECVLHGGERPGGCGGHTGLY